MSDCKYYFRNSCKCPMQKNFDICGSGCPSYHKLPEINPIKSCPFCNGMGNMATVKYGEKTVKEQGWSQGVFFYVSCEICGASTKGLIGQKSEEEAILKWNTRSNEK